MPFQKKRSTQPITPDDALAKMEGYCSYRERSPQEVRSKISELGIKGDNADQIFQVLTDDGYVNEKRFALAFAGGKFRINHWGRVRIRMELRQHQVASALINEALESIDEEEYLGALESMIRKKLAGYEGDDHANVKAMASMVRAGFEQHLVMDVMRKLALKNRQ